MKLAELCRIELRHDEAVVSARQRARDVAELLGFDRLEQTRIATAVSELARNARRYAGGGRVRLLVAGDRLQVEVLDEGPGIADIDAILRGEYSSTTGMGRGLIGVRLLMDEFEIAAPAGGGTRVTIVKRLAAGADEPDPAALRAELDRRGARSPFDEVTRQNEELLQALGEVRARQHELVALNRELESTNHGVVALYAELDDRAQQLREVDERKSRFLADMSHELRTPLNSIIALSELLLRGEPALVGEQTTQVSFIRTVAEDQLRLVGDLLDLAKIEAGRIDVELADVSLSELFVILRGQLRPLLSDPEVRLRFETDGSSQLLHTDEGKLIQILRNLVSNALKFTPSGEVVVAGAVEDGHATFTVSDTGIGMSAEDLARIFDEFVQIPGDLQRRGHGTGLGLSLVRRLVGVLDGRVDVSSVVGEGTTFTVSLPVRRGDVRGPGGDLTGAVLVVDDDETALYVVQAHLRGTSWRAVPARGGLAALAAIDASLPAAVILDLTMPDLGGFDVLERMRAEPRTAHVPVIVHTSSLLDAHEGARLTALGARVLDKSLTSRSLLLQTLSAVTRSAHGG